MCFVQIPGLEGCIPSFNLTVSTQKVYMDFHLNWGLKRLASGEKHQFFKTICLKCNDSFVWNYTKVALNFFHDAVQDSMDFPGLRS